jgi:hypothetical protein
MAVYNEEFDNAGISASSPLYLYAGLHQFIYTPLLNGGKTLELKRSYRICTDFRHVSIGAR